MYSKRKEMIKMLSEEMIVTMLKKVSDDNAERTPVIITYPSHWDDVGMMYLALTPSQLALLDILHNHDVFESEVNISRLTEIEWLRP
jgi:hypothetical protein